MKVDGDQVLATPKYEKKNIKVSWIRFVFWKALSEEVQSEMYTVFCFAPNHKLSNLMKFEYAHIYIWHIFLKQVWTASEDCKYSNCIVYFTLFFPF